MILTSPSGSPRGGGEVRITETERSDRVLPGRRVCRAGIAVYSGGMGWALAMWQQLMYWAAALRLLIQRCNIGLVAVSEGFAILLYGRRVLWGLVCLMYSLVIEARMLGSRCGLQKICGRRDMLSGLMSGLLISAIRSSKEWRKGWKRRRILFCATRRWKSCLRG